MARRRSKRVVIYDPEVLMASLMTSFTFQLDDGSAPPPEELERRLRRVARRLDEVVVEEFRRQDIEVQQVASGPSRSEDMEAVERGNGLGRVLSLEAGRRRRPGGLGLSGPGARCDR